MQICTFTNALTLAIRHHLPRRRLRHQHRLPSPRSNVSTSHPLQRSNNGPPLHLPPRLPRRHPRRLRRLRPHALDSGPRRRNACFRLATPRIRSLEKPATSADCLRLLRDCAWMYLHCFGSRVQCVCGDFCDSDDVVVFVGDFAAFDYGEEVCEARAGKSDIPIFHVTNTEAIPLTSSGCPHPGALLSLPSLARTSLCLTSFSCSRTRCL